MLMMKAWMEEQLGIPGNFPSLLNLARGNSFSTAWFLLQIPTFYIFLEEVCRITVHSETLLYGWVGQFRTVIQWYANSNHFNRFTIVIFLKIILLTQFKHNFRQLSFRNIYTVSYIEVNFKSTITITYKKYVVIIEWHKCLY